MSVLRTCLSLGMVGLGVAIATNLLGCPAEPAPTPPPASETSKRNGNGSETSFSPVMAFQLIEGTVMIPADVAGGKAIFEGMRLDEVEQQRAQGGAYRTLQVGTKAEVPVSTALVTVRGADLKTIPELTARYTTAKGAFYFENVPSKVAFFLEAQVETFSKTYQLLGLTRTENAGQRTTVIIDSASTMVARELMRIWQLSKYRLEFHSLDPRDFNPLLQRVRKKLENGFPAGVTLDPTKIAIPTGDWSFEADQKDSALMALERISAGDEAISKEIDRLYLAANYSVTHVRDASRNLFDRPPSLLLPKPTPSPSPTPEGAQDEAATTTP